MMMDFTRGNFEMFLNIQGEILGRPWDQGLKFRPTYG